MTALVPSLCALASWRDKFSWSRSVQHFQGKYLKGAFMASETFKKRQKEMARKEKQQKKAARRMERRDEKARPESKVAGENPHHAENSAPHGPTILLQLYV